MGTAAFGRVEHPEPYDEADARLVSNLAERAAVHIDNARLSCTGQSEPQQHTD